MHALSPPCFKSRNVPFNVAKVPYNNWVVLREIWGRCELEFFVPPYFKRGNVLFNVIDVLLICRIGLSTISLNSKLIFR